MRLEEKSNLTVMIYKPEKIREKRVVNERCQQRVVKKSSNIDDAKSASRYTV